MSKPIEIKIPDIGGATDVDVIELFVKVGDSIQENDPLLTLESDKASMEIPSPSTGVVLEILTKVGDKVSEGSLVFLLQATTDNVTASAPASVAHKQDSTTSVPKQAEKPALESAKPDTSVEFEVKVPDIGGAVEVDIIELLVKVGDSIQENDPLMTLESDKASMEIPSPSSGVISQLLVKVGDKVSEGTVILLLKGFLSKQQDLDLKAEVIDKPDASSADNESKIKGEPEIKVEPKVEVGVEATPKTSAAALPQMKDLSEKMEPATFSAGPAARRLARELGVNLKELAGSGRKARITKEDIQLYVKDRMSEKPRTGLAMPEQPYFDFAKFGQIEVKPLNKIKRLTGQQVHRSWISIPHVTQFDEADITLLEAFRTSENEKAKQLSPKLTVLAFVVKIVAKALVRFPQFNASLDASLENLIYKNYYNVGIAVETPNGLVVPVIKGVDQLSVGNIAVEMARLSQKAREKGLGLADMSGGNFTVSSLGGIGGTAFTPIVNSPEVAILGLSRAIIKPVYLEHEFKPRLMLPLSLSYDHRVIDGAEAARFSQYLVELLSDIRRIII